MSENGEPAKHKSAGFYKWLVVAILAFAYAFSYLDRLIITLMVEPIQSDFDLSKTQMGLLMGTAFAIFYTTCAIPFAWLADRYNRRNIIIAGITIWCTMTAVCGLAKNYLTLFLARMGVGLGEAALVPSANSMIADYFEEEQIGRAFAVFAIGIAMGAGLSYIVGSQILAAIGPDNTYTLPIVGELKGWQFTFFVLGLAGLAIAVLMLIVKEPERKFDEPIATGETKSGPTLSETLSYFVTHAKVYGPLYIGYACAQTCFYGVGLWTPDLIIGVFKWDVATFGTVYGVMVAVIGSMCAIGGGLACDKLYSKGIHNAHWVVLVGAISFIPFYCLIPLAGNGSIAMAILGITLFGSFAAAAAAPAAIVLSTPNEYRAIATALFFFTINIIGLMLGPLIVGYLTDNVFKSANGLPISMAVLSGVAWILALLIILTGRKAYSNRIIERHGVGKKSLETSVVA